MLPDALMDLWSQYEDLLWMFALVSVVTLVISAILVPYLIVILPADFYAESNSRHVLQDKPLLRALFLLVKNALGVVLFVAGLVMFFLPGQGILTMLAGLALLNFPGKRKLEMRFLHLPKVLGSINWLRTKAGREPLIF